MRSSISSSETCFVRPSLQSSTTLPQSRTMRVTSGAAFSPPTALDSTPDHRDVSAEVALESGVNTFYYIDPANPGAGVLLEGTLNFADGLRGRAVAFGETGARILNPYAPDRRSIETSAKLQLYNAAFNFEFIDIYIVPAGETIENSGAALAGVSRGFAGTTIPLPEGSYDIYIADLGGSEAISAPVRIDVVRGDVLGGIIYDTVDPAVVDVVLIADSL